MIFKWSFWGKCVLANIELLRCSVFSFRKQFGNSHKYVIYTDDVEFVSRQFGEGVDVRYFYIDTNSKFCVTSKSTWKKWCPTVRLDISQDEFLVDSDVFLLKYPKEIDSVLSNRKVRFAIMDEYAGKPFQHGAMRKKATPDTPFVNAGLFLQKAGSDITADLNEEFEWWQNNIKVEEQTHHDEQGALAVALTKYLVNGELSILPKDKYILVSPTSNPDLKRLDDVVLFHATYPAHPAFYKFKDVLDEILFDELKPYSENTNKHEYK